jgi:hypothetical protein
MEQNLDYSTDRPNDDYHQQDGNRLGSAAIEPATTTGQKRYNTTTDPPKPSKRKKVDSYTLELRERVLRNVFESDSIDAFMSRPQKDRVALYKAKLISPGGWRCSSTMSLTTIHSNLTPTLAGATGWSSY